MTALQLRKVGSASRQQLLTTRAAVETMRRAVVDHARRNIDHELLDRTSDWKNSPNFAIQEKITTTEIRVEVVPIGRTKKIFTYVDKGTRPHVIKPKTRGVRRGKAKPFLAFKWGGYGSYKPKTLPIARGKVGPGKVAGGHFVFAKEVHHPGTQARLFSETVARDTLPEFRKAIEAAFVQIARSSNKE